MEERVTRLERKLAALKGNVEGLHAIRVQVDDRIITLNSNINGISGTLAQLSTNVAALQSAPRDSLKAEKPAKFSGKQ